MDIETNKQPGPRTLSKMTEHLTAEQLILRAAKDAGLTEQVAEVLWWIDQHEVGALALDALRDALVDRFDDMICAPAIAMQDLYGEGLQPSPVTEAEQAEVAAFM
jgi:hypothetical protein